MRPDIPADHTSEAERLLRTAAQYPEDREPLLLQAAAHLELAAPATAPPASTTTSSPAPRTTPTW